jgi:hypothetical protein
MGSSLRWLAALALLALACDGGVWASVNQVASFREVPATEGLRLAAEPGAHLLQVGGAKGGPVSGAQLVEPDGPWPDAAAEPGPVVILAPDPKASYRLAARMARAGIQGIVVVSDGLDAWRAQQESQPGEADEIASAGHNTTKE